MESLPYPGELVSWASEPGHASFRNKQTGSWYINSLVKALGENHESQNLLEILKIVRAKVEKLSDKDGNGQRPTYLNGLNQKIYFRQNNCCESDEKQTEEK